MSVSSCRCFSSLLLAISLSIYASAADTATSKPVQPPSNAAPESPPQTYDQIVRLSLVEGDVRLSRGKEGEKATGAEWEQPATGTPVTTGFSLVTGKGRAEIELEMPRRFTWPKTRSLPSTSSQRPAEFLEPI